LYRILRRHQYGSIAHYFVHRRPIEEESVLAREAAAYLVISKSRNIRKVTRGGVVTRRAPLRSSLGNHPRDKCKQVHDITAVEGSFLHLSPFDHLAGRGILSVEQRGLFLCL
jgi:hypothetical protein